MAASSHLRRRRRRSPRGILAAAGEPGAGAGNRGGCTFRLGQLDLAELDRTRAQRAEAELRALRAQISPHFIYNSLTAIASFVRTDPERAREPSDFADFTRYSFRSHATYTTLADELRPSSSTCSWNRPASADGYRSDFASTPRYLGVRIPYLCLQPLVENAVQHGLEGAEGRESWRSPHRTRAPNAS